MLIINDFLNREQYIDVRKYEIYFECWPGYLMSEQSERVKYPVQHEEWISYFQTSMHCYVYYIKLFQLPYKIKQ